MQYYCCVDCSRIDKSRKKVSGISYRYGCETNGFTTGSIKKDSELKNMGCSNWKEIKKVVKVQQDEQLCLF